ncbi:MAG: T9SS type A sorting domain-containing protein, partial [Melioribacteraceae bacterium]|nr:T9SS type A sorting domain-containing protein [Melioribacteraceae bacterium]
IFKDSKNNIWLDSEIITKINDNTWTYFSPKFYGYPIKAITSINEDSDGNMWFGTNFKGLLKFDGTNWEIFDTTNSYIPSERVYDMEFDKDGNLWFITEWNLGLVKFDGIDFTIYDTTNSGIPTNYLHQIESDSEGNLWFGTLGEGLVKYDFNKWTIYDTQIKWNEISSLYIDDEDCVWIGGAGLTTFKNGSWAYYEHDDSIDYYLNSITHLTEDSDNNIWATARYGLYKFDGNNWQKFDHTNAGLPDEFLGDLEFDQYGNLWLGTSSGVILYKEGGVVTEINEAISTNMISKYELSQNYPNPFNPTTKIKYFIPSKAVMLNSFQHLNNSEIPKQVRDDEPLVILKIYDILGREVETLVNQQQKPGNFEVEWNAADQPSGIYFYQLSAGSYVDSRKMILLK